MAECEYRAVLSQGHVSLLRSPAPPTSNRFRTRITRGQPTSVFHHIRHFPHGSLHINYLSPSIHQKNRPRCNKCPLPISRRSRPRCTRWRVSAAEVCLFSCHAHWIASKYSPGPTAHLQHQSTSSMTTPFSTYSISIGHFC